MNTLKIALLQMASYRIDQEANLTKGEVFCRQAAAMGADIALFPELWNIGYTFGNVSTPAEQKRFATQAVSQDDSFFTHFVKLAKELKMAIAITYLEKWPGRPRNTISLIDRHGNVLFTYSKVHTCEFNFEDATTPGEDFYVCTLDTAAGDVKIGAMICYDREFPESARILMLKGAEIILTPNACELEENRLSQFRTRAFENMVGMAMTNYASPQENGHSVAFDGVCFEVTVGGRGKYRNSLIVEAGREEGVYIAPFDLQRLRTWRKNNVWGNAYRHPHRYSALVDEKVETPFKRKKATR